MEIFTAITLVALARLSHAWIADNDFGQAVFLHIGDCTSSPETYLGTTSSVRECEKLCKQRLGNCNLATGIGCDCCRYFTFAASGAGGCYYEPDCKSHNGNSAWKGYIVSYGAYNCPVAGLGFEQKPGDIPGWGRINGKGGRQSVVDCDECAELCLSESQCKSYECSPTTLYCNLNTGYIPTAQPYQDYVFCVRRECPHGYNLHRQRGACVKAPGAYKNMGNLIETDGFYEKKDIIATVGLYEEKDYLLLGALVSNMILVIALVHVCCKMANQSSVNAYKKVRNENYSSQDEENELIQ